MTNANKVLRNIIIGGIFLLPFIPLIVYNHFFFPFITAKNFPFRIIVELLTGLWLILALRDHTVLPKMSRILQAFAIFIAVIFVSDLLSPNVYKSFWSNFERMEGWVTLTHLFALFVVASSVLNKKLWEWLFRVSIFASLILFVYGLLQLAGNLPIHQGSTRIDTTIGNSSYLGGYMLFHVFLGLYFLLGSIKKYRAGDAGSITLPIIYGFAVAADIFTLFGTATRGSEIGLAAGLFVLAIGLAFFERESQTIRRAGTCLLITVLVLGGLFVVGRNSTFVKSHESLSRLAAVTDQLLTFDKKAICEGDFKSRCLLWPMSWQGVKERPIFGWGQESFNYVFNKYYDPRMFAQEQWFDRTHNIVLDWLIAGGFVGLIAYFSIFGVAIYYLWRKASHFPVFEKSVWTALLVAYFFHNLTVFDNITSYLLFIFVIAYLHTSVAVPLPRLSGWTAKLDSGLTNRFLIPIVSIATVFTIYKVNIPAMLASTELIGALSGQQGGPSENLKHYEKVFSYHSFGDSEAREQLVQAANQAAGIQNVDQTAKAGFFALAQKQMTEQLRQTPDDARYQLFTGSFLASFGDFDNAMAHLNKAHELSPKKQTILFTIGSAYLNNKNYPAAAATLKKAFDLEHEYAEARRFYALALIYNKDIAGANAVLAPLAPEHVLEDQRFVLAYFTSGYHAKALEHVNWLLERNPANIQYYFVRAAVKNELGRRTEAIADINQAVSLNPSIKQEADYYIAQIKAGKSI